MRERERLASTFYPGLRFSFICYSPDSKRANLVFQGCLRKPLFITLPINFNLKYIRDIFSAWVVLVFGYLYFFTICQSYRKCMTKGNGKIHRTNYAIYILIYLVYSGTYL